jgi:hypothetical protein
MPSVQALRSLGTSAAIENTGEPLDIVAVPFGHVYGVMRLVSFSSEQFL